MLKSWIYKLLLIQLDRFHLKIVVENILLGCFDLKLIFKIIEFEILLFAHVIVVCLNSHHYCWHNSRNFLSRPIQATLTSSFMKIDLIIRQSTKKYTTQAQESHQTELYSSRYCINKFTIHITYEICLATAFVFLRP